MVNYYIEKEDRLVYFVKKSRGYTTWIEIDDPLENMPKIIEGMQSFIAFAKMDQYLARRRGRLDERYGTDRERRKATKERRKENG